MHRDEGRREADPSQHYRGKSMLLDIFFHSLPVPHKVRFHVSLTVLAPSASMS